MTTRAPRRLAASTGIGLESWPSEYRRAPIRTGEMIPGTALEARTAAPTSPALKMRDSPVARSVATIGTPIAAYSSSFVLSEYARYGSSIDGTRPMSTDPVRSRLAHTDGRS